MRMSHEDGDAAESESIGNQRKLIADYCRVQSQISLVGEYVDDGYTGTNFNRPQFRQMLLDIDAGKINCVIVKDLSRFGRDYIDVGYYLERFFPERKVRFIAIGEGVDSENGPYDMMLPLRNILNAQYAKDTSDKVRKTFRAKQQRGEFVSAFAPYGYVKDPENKNHFLVDPEAALVVQRIFNMAANGENFSGIARTLNAEGIASPIEYKRQHNCALSISGAILKQSYWSSDSVRRILKNEVYTGAMVSNRFPTDGIRGRTTLAPRSEWIIVEGMHEPVITKEQWQAVQNVLSAATRQRSPKTNKSLFAGLLRCGDCGRALVKKSDCRKTYFCSAFKDYGSVACTKHLIRESDLVDIVLEDLNQIIAAVTDIDELVREHSAVISDEDAEKANKKRVEAALDRIRRVKKSTYEDYRAGVLSREDFLQRKREYDEQENALKQQLCECDAICRESDAMLPWCEKLRSVGRLEELDRVTLEQTVKQICVFADGRIEITYLFSKELENILKGK